MERAAEDEVSSGRLAQFDNVEDFLADLDET
jgi:hypothetical protein